MTAGPSVFAPSPDRARTTILVSHDLNLAAEHCDRLLLLAGGTVQAFGTPKEVMTPHQLDRAYGCTVEIEVDPNSDRPRLRSSLGRPDAVSRATYDPRI